MQLVKTRFHEPDIVKLDKAAAAALGRVIALVEAADIGGVVGRKVGLHGFLGCCVGEVS